MADIIRDGLLSEGFGTPEIVDRSTFQAELDALRVREKAHTREGDAVAAPRRRLPMVKVDGNTPLIGKQPSDDFDLATVPTKSIIYINRIILNLND